MDAENLEILRISWAINDGDVVGLRSIDTRIMRTHPAVVLNGELLPRVRQLIKAGALVWQQENASVRITEEGKALLAS